MKSSKGFFLGAAAIGVLAAGAAYYFLKDNATSASASVVIDADDIGGVVQTPDGKPEAGVWVIAETRDLAVRYIKIVVTDDSGRFVLPDLPAAKYDIWVRGYGLVDSEKVQGAPGASLSLTSAPAPTPADAAKYYPAIYWYSMLNIPPADQFGGADGEIPAATSRETYIARVKNIGCIGCHQLGQESTRTLPDLYAGVPHEEAWLRRVQAGQGGSQMISQISGIIGMRSIKEYADWTTRVAAGELPHAQPERPQGQERNVVITLRDWMNEKQYLHDAMSSDKRYPTVNAYGPLFGQPEYSSDTIPIIDPVKNVASTFTVPVQEGTPEALGPGHAAGAEALLPSPYWDMEKIWDTKANIHNAMFDRDGRLWMTAAFRPPENPDFCKAGSDHPSAKLFPLESTSRTLTFLVPTTMEYTYVNTCFGNHHLQFGFDANETLWTSGGGPVLGWVNTKKFLETGDAAASQGWTAFVLDTNGNGRRDADYVEPNDALDPAKDKRINGGFYAVMPSPIDSSVWGTVGVFGGTPAVVRVVPGDNPPETAISEIYNLPPEALGVRGGDIDKKGVVWVSASSGHLAAFDRSKCKAPLNGPESTGNHCPEGWTLHQYPGPGFKGLGENSAESSYYTWVDQHNILGLGEDVPMSTANLNDGVVALVGNEWVKLRVPYPLGFYTKGFDGRIDDPNGGWKARGLWVANGDRTPWLIEGGKGTKPLLAHIQLRPDPLAK